MSVLRNSQLLFRPIDGRPGWWRLEETLTYVTHDGVLIQVPEGFETDLASIPRPLWSILPPYGQYTAGAVLHDYIYSVNGVLPVLIRADMSDLVLDLVIDINERIHIPDGSLIDAHWKMDRKWCDLMVFKESMKDLGVDSWKQFSLVHGVRAGGWAAWNKHGKRIAAEGAG